MPTITINGRQVSVGQEFLGLTPEQQDATVDEIAASMGGAQPAPSQDGQPASQPQQDGNWMEPGMLAPVQFEKGTGDWRFATPRIVSEFLGAAEAPGRALQGQYNQREVSPDGTVSPFDPRMVEDAETLGAFVTPGSRVPRVTTPGAQAAGAAVRDAQTFNIPMTRGQTTGDIRQLAREEQLRQMEGAGRSTMTRFDERQGEALTRASDDIARGMGDATNMAERVSGSLRGKVAESRSRSGELYRKAFNSDAAMDASAIQGLPNIVTQRLDEAGLFVDDALTPASAAAYRQIEKALNKDGAFAPIAPGAERLSPEGQISLKAVDQLRRRISRLQGTNPTDAAVLGELKRGFDDWVDETVDTALFSGDEAAIEALKAARKEASFYKGLTNPKAGDTAGKRLAQMQSDDVTAREVGNWLYGADIVSPSLESPRVAGRLRQVLGPDSAEFAAIRASGWDRLVRDLGTGEMRSVKMVAKRIENFTNGKGSDLARVLYTPEQLAKMRQFSQVLKRLDTPADARNPSRSAMVLGPMVQQMMNLFLAGTAAQTFGTAGLAGAMAMPVLKNARNLAAAKKATAGIGSAERAVGGQTPNMPILTRPLMEESIDRLPQRQSLPQREERDILFKMGA